MKTKYKYLLLIIFTVLASAFIYEFIEANTMVDYESDLLLDQKNIDVALKDDFGYTIDSPKVVLNPYGISPLSALVVFETKDLTSVTTTLKGRNGDDDIINTFVPAKVHYIPIYGLYPNYENRLIIKASNDTKELIIKTDALPNGINNSDFKSEGDEFYFTTSSDSLPVAYDKNGNVRWYLTKKFNWEFTRLHNGYILLGSDELVKAPDYSSSLLEMDLLGKVYYEYLLPNGYHHDVCELDNGNFLVLTSDFDSDTVKDVIVEIDRRTGEVLKNINLYNLLPNDNGKDWINLNSISFDASTNSIIVSGSNNNSIINIDYTSGEINWSLGLNNSTDLNINNKITNPFGVNITQDGLAFVNTKDGIQYLALYKVNSDSKETTEVFNVELGKETLNVNLNYESGKYLVSRDNLIQIVSTDGNLKTLSTANNVYGVNISSLYAGDMFMLNDGVKLGSTGVTHKIRNHSLFLYKNDKNIFKKYDLSLVQNSNRLIVKGTFSKKDDVQIVLDNVLAKSTFDVDLASGKQLDGDKVYTETIINKQGIYGKHYVFLRINGKMYKLHKYIV